MDIRINQELTLETDIPFQSVYEFRMTWEINEHAEMKIKGILESGENETSHKNTQGIVKLLLKKEGEHEMSRVLFCGPITYTDLKQNHGITYIELKAQSPSVKLDYKKLCCSYQKQSQTYAEVMKDIIRIENGSIICTTEAKSTDGPLICYKETIWEFVKRLASHQNSYIIPDILTGRPNLWFGMRKGAEMQEDESLQKIKIEIVKNYACGEKGNYITRYRIECGNDYSLGDWMVLYRKKCFIYKKEARFEAGELGFVYALAEETDLRTETCYNQDFNGLSLTGKIEDTEKERFKVKFDMDGKGGEYFFTWRPETGNTLYTMPEEGESVAVYFMTCDERTGIGVRCLDLSGDSSLSSDTKTMETGKKRSVKLSERSMELINGESAWKVIDNSKISFNSGTVEIQGNGKIKFRAEEINLECSSEFKASTDRM